ncbi:DUF1080 domain-containing protein [Maribacter sp.]|uniref:DUF1080 domain-containing protein n=1 Tax=Maribacter sp. TaxID=1897614 RepID=UPI0025C2472F|nr:DUF1080 domain-containing protein [Maribacter sp.]
MKKTIIKLSTLLFMVCTLHIATAQINRTLETKVVDVLAQLPTKDLNHSDAVMQEITGLGAEGILKFTDMLVPLGSGDDTKARYAIHSLAVYTGGKNNTTRQSVVEGVLLQAIEKTTDNEVKTFLIDQLLYCGTDASVPLLSTYLKKDALYKPALAALTTIHTEKGAQAILNTTKTAAALKKPAFVKALGELEYKPATKLLQGLSVSGEKNVQQKAVLALAQIAPVSAMDVLVDAAAKSNYRLDNSKAIVALVHYAERLHDKGDIGSSIKVAEAILANCKAEDQLHYRSAAMHLLRKIKGTSFTKILLKEAKNENLKYSASVISAASNNLSSPEVALWVKAYKKASDNGKIGILRMLSKREESTVFDTCILSSLKDKNKSVREAGIKALANQNKSQSLPTLLTALKGATSPEEYSAVEETLLRVCSVEDSKILANTINVVGDSGKQVLVNVLAARKASSQFSTVASLINTGNDALKTSVFKALPSLASSKDLSMLLELLNTAKEENNIASTQKAIIQVLDNSDTDNAKEVLNAYAFIQEKERILPILPALQTDTSLLQIVKSLNAASSKEKMGAINALANWRNNDALPYLFGKASTEVNSELRASAFTNYLAQVRKSSYPEDQKLLLARKLMPYSKSVSEKKEIIQTASTIKTFLSLVFVSEFLERKNLVETASNAAIRIALPTPGVKNGLGGNIVRDIVSKSVNNLTGPDSQYVKIDVKEFLDNMSTEEGFVSIFNGKDFTGWEGLVENPIARNKMSKRKLKKAQAKANKQMMADWFIKDGIIGFQGEGYNNICTIKDYGDFEILVDWKITKGGDSGIYLRGAPQVQIWDTALVEVGAQVGSGGLYNNQKNRSTPLEVADNPIDEWNTFRIKMVGERVTVHLNGVLVTDNVILENYWDRELPIFPKEAIELQAHGEDLGFRNIFVREITSGDILLSPEEKSEGFKSLFNGKDLDHWIGNKTDYLVLNNQIAVRPKQGGHGNLFTAEEYSDFNFRFEFKLTSGANNGLGIHAPLEGDVAYEGKELQILDNTAAIYKDLKNHQYHGSVYGIIAAERGYLKPVGEWNSEEVIVQGDRIKIILNGKVILDGDVKEATKNGTLDNKDHPGLHRKKGHIAFLGHGSELEFRNIRVKDLSK